MRLPIPLWIIMAIFVGATLAFSSATPYRQSGVLRTVKDPTTGLPQSAKDIGAPDERQHANYISYLKSGKGFPILKSNDPDLYENYQAHQPPLFYIVAAGWSAIVGAEPSDESAGIRLRFLNTIIGLISIMGIYYCAFWAFARKEVALSAAAFFALIPMNVALHSAISNDPLLYCLMIWTVGLTLKCVQQGWTRNYTILIGFLTGLAILTKTTGLALIPMLIASFVVTAIFHDKDRLPTWKSPVIALVTPFLFAGPWLYRNLQIYGDPFALKIFNQSFTGSAQASMFIDSIGAGAYWTNFVTWFTSRSFVGVFGYMDVYILESLGSEKSGRIYLAVIVLIFATILIGIFSTLFLKSDIENRSLPNPNRAHIILWTLTLVVFALFIRFNNTYFQGQARYLYPAMAALASWFGLGIVTILNSRDNGKYAWAVTVVFFLLLDFLSFSTIKQGFPIRLTP